MEFFYTVRAYLRDLWAEFKLWAEPPPDIDDYEGDEDNDPDESDPSISQQ